MIESLVMLKRVLQKQNILFLQRSELVDYLELYNNSFFFQQSDNYEIGGGPDS